MHSETHTRSFSECISVDYADFAVKLRVTTTLFCEIAMLARLGGWMPKSVMYMVLVDE
jgi:hypothetical protein